MLGGAFEDFAADKTLLRFIVNDARRSRREEVLVWRRPPLLPIEVSEALRCRKDRGLESPLADNEARRDNLLGSWVCGSLCTSDSRSVALNDFRRALLPDPGAASP